MNRVIPLSILLGLIWNLIAVGLMGGGLKGALTPAWLLAGAIAGVAAGTYTVWSRKRSDGDEKFLHVLATFYLGMVSYWLSFVVIQRAIMCVRHGGWTDFDLHDHVSLIVTFFVYGTLMYGAVLIPLSYLSRLLIWKVYSSRD